MRVTKYLNGTTSLLITTAMIGMVILPNASYSLDKLARDQEQNRQRVAQLQAQVHAGGHAVGNLQRHKNALADPGATLAAAGAGTLTAAIAAASADAASAATGMPHVTDAEKIAIIQTVEGGGAGDDAHKSAIRTALGIDPTQANHVATAGEVNAFVTAAEERLVRLPGKTVKAAARKIEVANLTKFSNALTDSGAALAAVGAGTLMGALGAAVADAGSAANGLAIGNNTQKITALEAIEGGGAGDDAHRSAIRTALGIDPDPANFVATNPRVHDFFIIAKSTTVLLPQIDARLGPVGAGNQVAKIRTVITRLNAGTHSAGAHHGVVAGNNIGAAGGAGAPNTVEAALQRLGL
jgi:hypothetical protein